jgi:virginiamycin B lyase
LWFTEIGFTTGKIGRISTTGIITGEFTIPTAYAQPNDIASGPDGNLWFTEATGYNIGRITTAGTITEFAVPFYPLGGITTGPDENLWFTVETNKIGRITTDGLITGVFHTPATNSAPLGITAGPDGNLWFTEINGDRIGRISTAGAGRESPSKSGIAPDGITVGPDGNIWFTELSGNAIAVFRLS